MFNFADHNHDGKLDSDEVFMMALPQYWPNKQEWYDFKAGDHMDTMDTNQDGFVDWKEYDDEMKQVIDGWDDGIGVRKQLLGLRYFYSTLSSVRIM
jgi:hypothetical protein